MIRQTIEIYLDAELLAIDAALVHGLSLFHRKVCMLSDSRAALQPLYSDFPTDYTFRISVIFSLICQLNEKKKTTFNGSQVYGESRRMKH